MKPKRDHGYCSVRPTKQAAEKLSDMDEAFHCKAVLKQLLQRFSSHLHLQHFCCQPPLWTSLGVYLLLQAPCACHRGWAPGAALLAPEPQLPCLGGRPKANCKWRGQAGHSTGTGQCFSLRARVGKERRHSPRSYMCCLML